jgi:hypothetical protein
MLAPRLHWRKLWLDPTVWLQWPGFYPFRAHFPPIPAPGSSGPAVMLCNHHFCYAGRFRLSARLAGPRTLLFSSFMRMMALKPLRWRPHVPVGFECDLSCSSDHAHCQINPDLLKSPHKHKAHRKKPPDFLLCPDAWRLGWYSAEQIGFQSGGKRPSVRRIEL